MPDLAMCSNRTCELRSSCFRYRAHPTPLRQAYGDFAPSETGDCDYLWPIAEGDPVRGWPGMELPPITGSGAITLRVAAEKKKP
jgi:hypothetical protein